MNADRRRPPEEAPRRRGRHAPTTDADPPPPPADVHADSAPPATPAAIPDSTFAASQLAERLQILEANLRAISAGQTPWTPAQSDLNLRDRTV